MRCDPNEPTRSDLLEIRKRMKGMLTPAFATAVDAGELDGYGVYYCAEAEVIRQRTSEEQPDA